MRQPGEALFDSAIEEIQDAADDQDLKDRVAERVQYAVNPFGLLKEVAGYLSSGAQPKQSR